MPQCIQVGTATSLAIAPASTASQRTPTGFTPVRNILKSARNTFGLFRQYHATRFPDHDPNESVVFDDIVDAYLDTPFASPAKLYYPYPNQSSFLLGEWYWNGGTQKSQSSFQNLLKIVGHPEFRPEDVANKSWRSIDAQLSGDRRCEGLNGSEDGWENELSKGNWTKTSIRINVPFHKNMLHPGQKEFDAGMLHHRKLISVIKERITRLSSHPHFHFEPYRLFWQPNETSQPVGVYGELYTSDAFIEAHSDLQDSPGEPGCDLPRVVAGLMFASDGTHLTQFSNAKLSPIYLGFGNESKNRRSKPSCQAFEHIAYFETVSMTLWLLDLEGTLSSHE
jgi:hypothetical protein